jgi:[acyl-carrier-protein] S-malonyltransferase
MLTPWLDLPGAKDLVTRWSDAAGVDLVRHGTTSPAEVIKDTAITQPLLITMALLSYRALMDAAPGLHIDLVAGHSVGELAAAAIAGVITDDDALRAAGERGRAMAACAAEPPTGMAAVIGGVEEDVLAAIGQAGATPANFNGPGQIVAGGTLAALDTLAAAAPRRTRVIPLDVAGAFHTSFMADAVPALEAALATATVRDAAIPMVSNADGEDVTDGPDIVHRLTLQVVRPVRWDKVQRTLADRATDTLVELAPAGVLTGLAKRGLKGTRALGITTPEDLPAIIEQLTTQEEPAA